MLTAAAAVVLAPRRAVAQGTETVPRVGVFANPSLAAALRAGLTVLGYREGQNIVLDIRDIRGARDLAQVRATARELVDAKVRVIVVGGTENVTAVREVAGTIPIVMTAVGDPIGQGLIASFARPGGNVTGVSNVGVNLEGKRLELLKEAAPRVKKLAVLWNPEQPAHPGMLDALDAAAQTLGIVVQRVAVRSAADVESVFAAVTREHASGITMLGSLIHTRALRTIADFALRSKLPSVAWTEEFVRAGGLLAYGPSGEEQYRRAAAYVDRILKGARPAELPVEQPTTLRLTINRKTATALGLTVPQSLLVRADEIVE